MNVQPISNNLSYNNKNNNVQNNKAYSYQTNLLSNSTEKQQAPSFKGALTKGANNVFKFIDKSSFFVEFLIIDTLSMVAPRIAMGLLRDKDQLGHLNWKAAKEEAGREVLSGPSMNLIPMGIMLGATSVKPASRMERDYLTYLSETAKSLTEDGKQLTSKQIAEKIFDSNYKNLNADKETFTNLLEKTTTTKGKEHKKAVAEFANKVSELNNKIAEKTAPIHTDKINFNLDEKLVKELNLKSDSISASNLAESFGAFKKDIIAKLDNAKKPTAKETSELIDKLKSNRSALKLGYAITAFIAVGTFLKTLPKLYQQKGLSPAQESALRASGQLPKDGGNA